MKEAIAQAIEPFVFSPHKVKDAADAVMRLLADQPTVEVVEDQYSDEAYARQWSYQAGMLPVEDGAVTRFTQLDLGTYALVRL